MSGLAGLESFSGFSVDDLERAKAFYTGVLGLTLTDESDFGFGLVTASQTIFVYDKGRDHAPATYTVLNFQTADVDSVVDELTARGVRFLRYEGTGQDEKGVARDFGPTIAWFADPAGNVVSVISDSM
ncbi:VOC family protein [Nocardioides bigeumensis]|uniref:VOC domain-containing protein n=1 Tax=Nocardioides bigeumensis TaxID=433657 RepID=A0ABP5K2K1_9ACTN